LTSVETMNKYKMGTSQNISKNKKILQNRDIIEKTKDGFTFLDPVFNRWFVSVFLKKTVRP
jgi:hypothetical protein